MTTIPKQVANTLNKNIIKCQARKLTKSKKCTGRAVCTVPFGSAINPDYQGDIPMCIHCAKPFINNEDYDDFK